MTPAPFLPGSFFLPPFASIVFSGLAESTVTMPTETLDQTRSERRLAAILAADVAGWSRLMGADEEGTLARLKALRRELIDVEIERHRGRIVKTTGDGVLVEFPSVVDALRCAIRVQDAMRARNAGAPAETRI